MKKIIYLVTFLSTLYSCSKEEVVVIKEVPAPVAAYPYPIENLGLSTNNTYPFYPYTWRSGLGDNMWFDHLDGKILTVTRRDNVYDDAGDQLIYTFLINNGLIYPINVKRVSSDAYIIPQRFAQIMFDKPIQNFRLQEFTPNKVLICEITTANGDYNLQKPVIDKMYIKLDD